MDRVRAEIAETVYKSTNLQKSLKNARRETLREASSEFAEEQIHREAGIRQDIVSSATQKIHQQEYHKDKDSHLSPRVTWSNPEPGTGEDTCEVIQSGQRDQGSFSQNPSHGPVSDSIVDHTFLTNVTGQGEGLAVLSFENKSCIGVKGHDVNSTIAADGGIILPAPGQVTGCPKPSRPRTSVRNNVRSGQRMPPRRPYSAVNTLEFSNGRSDKLSAFNPSFANLRSDFQQLREDFWKGSNPYRRSRPKTVAMPTSDRVDPPPQRPPSPAPNGSLIKSRGLKVTSAKAWLGGGRDLYWEHVQSRPKSGHTPGWKEGMPDSMRTPRSKSAQVTSTRLLFPKAISSRYSIMEGVCCQSDNRDKAYMMPEAFPLLQDQFPPTGSPESEVNQATFPPLNQSSFFKIDV